MLGYLLHQLLPRWISKKIPTRGHRSNFGLPWLAKTHAESFPLCRIEAGTPYHCSCKHLAILFSRPVYGTQCAVCRIARTTTLDTRRLEMGCGVELFGRSCGNLEYDRNRPSQLTLPTLPRQTGASYIQRLICPSVLAHPIATIRTNPTITPRRRWHQPRVRRSPHLQRPT